MAFTPATFLPISAMSNSDAPKHWTYATGDNKATAVASGYFDNAVALGLQAQDLIWVVGVTGGTEVFTLIFVDAITSGTVTTLSSTLTLA